MYKYYQIKYDLHYIQLQIYQITLINITDVTFKLISTLFVTYSHVCTYSADFRNLRFQIWMNFLIKKQKKGQRQTLSENGQRSIRAIPQTRSIRSDIKQIIASD